MLHRSIKIACLLLFTLPLLLPGVSYARTISSFQHQSSRDSATVPAVDPDYIYNQLSYMVSHYQHREAGYDNNAPVNVNGHDEFGAYGSQEMMRNLQSFGAQVLNDPFPIKGWQGRPAIVPAYNVEVTVPGITHPEQIVVIGCHYDGEAISNQSAYDDASGCAIELGVAKAMAEYWHTTHTYPARTLRFVIFDAEEQGLYGSFHYLDTTINGDIHNIVAMFNEEQNGIAYPLRYLGQAANPLYPLFVSLSPLQDNGAYPNQSQLSQQQQNAIRDFRTLMQQAIAPTFALFRSEGFQNLTYHTGPRQDTAQPIFTPDQLSNVQLQDDPGLGSDQVPFTLAGVPCATLSGNYEPDPKYPRIPQYPYDTPVDTIQLMNTFADGSSQQSQALTLALALSGQLTAWMLHQPGVLGESAADGNPIAAISDIGQTLVNQNLTLDAKASFDPQPGTTPPDFHWNFGDGATAEGVNVEHAYNSTGTYTLTLTAHDSNGTRSLSKIITVTTSAPSFANPFINYHPTGIIGTPPGIPIPNDSLTDKVSPGSLSITSSSTNTNKQSRPVPASAQASARFPTVLAVSIVIVLLVCLVVLFVMSRRRKTRASKDLSLPS